MKRSPGERACCNVSCCKQCADLKRDTEERGFPLQTVPSDVLMKESSDLEALRSENEHLQRLLAEAEAQNQRQSQVPLRLGGVYALTSTVSMLSDCAFRYHYQELRVSVEEKEEMAKELATRIEELNNLSATKQSLGNQIHRKEFDIQRQESTIVQIKREKLDQERAVEEERQRRAHSEEQLREARVELESTQKKNEYVPQAFAQITIYRI